MSEENPYEGSPYDASGMPLATETADYDNFAEVAQKMVADKVVTYPENPNDNGFEEEKIEMGDDISEKNFNSAIADNVNSAYPLEFETEDTADKGESRKLSVVEKDGFTETIETPMMGNSAFLDKGHEEFLAALEPEKPVEEEKKEENQ